MIHFLALVIFFLPYILLFSLAGPEFLINLALMSFFIAPFVAGFLEIRKISRLKKDKLINIVVYFLILALVLIFSISSAFSTEPGRCTYLSEPCGFVDESSVLAISIGAYYLFSQVAVILVFSVYMRFKKLKNGL